MFSQLFKFLLEKKISFCVALVVPWLIWAASGAAFGTVIILDKADFQNGAKEVFILTLFLGAAIAMFFILIEFGLPIFLNRKLENKDAKIVNDNIIKGKIRKDISNEGLVNLYYSLDKVYNLLSVRNWQWTLTITIILSFVDYFNSFQLSTTLMILTVGFVVAFLTNIYNTTLAGGELMFPLRKECKEMLNSRRLFYKDIFTTSLQEKFRMFIILIIFLLLLILFFSYPLTPNLIIISLIGLAMAITIIRVIFLSFYRALNEIQLLAENMGRGEKVVFYSGSTDREIIVLEKSLNRTAENIKEYQTNLEEAKTTLEIKVRARTKELEELAKGLDEQVKERTKKLEERVNELERFRKLTVGRELKMVELKEEIKGLKEKLEISKKA